MLFRSELADKIIAGEKTATRRLPKDNPRSPWWWKGCRYKVGHPFPIMANFNEPARGYAIVDRVALERLGAIDHDQARAEGFDSIAAFFAKFEEINSDLDPMAWVWVVEFHFRPGSNRV